jgi:hypothetical protein
VVFEANGGRETHNLTDGVEKNELHLSTDILENPQNVLGNKISVSDIDGLKIFKFYVIGGP